MIKSTQFSEQKKINEQRTTTSSVNIKSAASPALAVYNGHVYMVWRGTSTTQLWYSTYNESGQENWSIEKKVRTDAKSSVAPALAELNGKLYLAYVGAGKKLCYSTLEITDDAGSAAWLNPVEIGDDFKSNDGPSLINCDGKLHMAWKGTSDTTLYYSYFNDVGGKWEKEEKIAGVDPDHGPCMASFRNTPVIGSHCSDSQYQYQTYNEGSNSWSSPGLVGVDGKAVSDADGAIEFFGEGDLLYAFYRKGSSIHYAAFDGESWLYEIDVTKINGAKTKNRVALVRLNQNGNDKILMVWRSAAEDDDTLWQCYFEPNAIFNTEIYAHRGNVYGENVNHKDNTLDAIQAAIKSGVDGVEFDIQKDTVGEFYVHHDDLDDTLANIKKKYPYVSSFDDVLELDWGDTEAVIELKMDTVKVTDCEMLIEKVIASGHRFSIISFSIDLLNKIAKFWEAKLDPAYEKNLSLGYLAKSVPDIDKITEFKKAGYSVQWSVLIEKSKIVDPKVDGLIKKGYKIGVWTVNGKEALSSYLHNSKVEIIITDDPFFLYRGF